MRRRDAVPRLAAAAAAVPGEVPEQAAAPEQTPAAEETRRPGSKRTGSLPGSRLPSVVPRRRRGVEEPALAPAAGPAAEQALATWIDNIPQGQKEVWKDLVSAVSGWREEMLTYFETDIPITNAFT